jgi:hypothetical protein
MNTTPTTRHADARSSDARAQFSATLNELNELRLGYEDPETRRLHAAYVDELRAALKRLSPRARMKHDPSYEQYPMLESSELRRRLEKRGAEGVAAGDAIMVKHQPLLQARADFLYSEVERLAKRLAELAPLAELRRAGAGGEWFYLDSRRAGDYGSQGYGALRYAEGSVQLTADVARAEGFVDGVDLVVVTARDYDEVVIAAVRVESEVDAEIVRRCPPLSLREQVRRCWKRGVNPRVLNPFLPHGYEEQVGLDFFGGDLRATAASTTST